jgi:hypothetical protein
MTSKCVKCKKKIQDGDGCYRSPYGDYCGDCGESKPWLKLAKKEKEHVKPRKATEEKMFELGSMIRVGKYKISGELLGKYISKVDYLRRATNIGVSCHNPLIIQKALSEREDIHREIFKSVNLPYHTDRDATDESVEFNIALDRIITLETERTN